MHRSCPKYAFHKSGVAVRRLSGYECLDRAGKAAAVDTPRTTISHVIRQVGFRQTERQGQALLRHVFRGVDVLQIAIAGIPGLSYQSKERIHVPPTESRTLFFHPLVLRHKMESTQYSPITAGFPQSGNVFHDVRLRQRAQHLLPQRRRHGFHLRGNGGVILVQIGVIAAGVRDAEGKARTAQIKIQFFNHRLGRIGKVNGNKATHRTGGLIHQPAGLAEIHVFCKLRHFCDLYVGHPTAVIQMIQNIAHHHLKSGGGGQTRSLQYV